MTFNGRLKDHPVVSTIAERKSEEAKRIPPPKRDEKDGSVVIFLFYFLSKKKKKRDAPSITSSRGGERNEWAQDTRKRNLKKKKRKFRRTKTGQMSWVTHSGLNWDPFSNGTSTEEQAVVIELLSSSLSH